jgi:hypothetical protein
MVQPKYSPEEALQRIKLMMEYDSSKTLDENKKVISEQVSLNTAGSTALGAGLGAAAAAGTTLGASIATGAAFGTAIPIPVVGTALGALVGLGVGMLGTWAFNKDGNAEGFRKLMEVCKAPGASKLVKKMSNGDIRSIAYAIQDSKGTWNDDEDTIAAELGKIQTIADLCAVDKKVPGGLFEFLNDLTDDPDEWKLFTRPIEGMIEDSEVLLTPEEQKKTGGGGGGSKTGGYKPCSGTYSKGCKSDTIAKVQGCLGLVTDGKFGPKTQAALSGKGFTTFTDADVTKICQSKPTEVEPEISGETQTISGNSDF